MSATHPVSGIYLQSAMDHAAETAGHLLRRARSRANMSQIELAARAGVMQSVISAYESGRRQPALPMPARLIDAAGYDLVVDIRRRQHLSRLSGPVGRKVRRRRRQLVAAAAALDMTYRDRQRLTDIRAAIDVIRSHLRHGDLSDGLVSDAVLGCPPTLLEK
jgi:transcriptional regulator with XRE-family HTH domain